MYRAMWDSSRQAYPASITFPGFSAFHLSNTLKDFHETSMNFMQLYVAREPQTLAGRRNCEAGATLAPIIAGPELTRDNICLEW